MSIILEFRKILFLLLTTAIIACILPDAVAQKKKAKNKKEDERQSVLAEEDRRIAEMYFTEAQKHYLLEDYAKANELFGKALELDSQNSAINYMIAKIYLENEELDKAVLHAEQALRLDPNNKYFYLLVADIYTKQSNFSKVTEVFEAMIENIPGTEEYLFETAAYYIYQDNFEKALDCYDRIEEKFGVSEQVSLQKKNIYIRQGKLEKAIEEIQKLIEAYPGEPDYLIQYSEILLTNDKIDQAIDVLEKGRQEYPDNTKIQLYLYESYRKTGRHEEAQEALHKVFSNRDLSLVERQDIIDRLIGQLPNSTVEKELFELADATLEIYPDKSGSYLIYGKILYELDSINAAKDMYIKATQLDQRNLEAWQYLLEIELRENELDSVIVHSETAMEIYPNQAFLYYFNGTAYFLKNEFNSAVRAFEQGKKLSSSNLELRAIFNGQLGDAYNSLKEYEKSDKAYEEALDFDPNSDHVLNNYSYFLSLRKEKLDLAIKMSTKLINRNPDNATYLDTHAWVLYNMGDIEQAKTFIEKAIQQEDNVSATIVEHYGDILFKLGDIDGAVEQWQKAKKMDVSSELLDKKIADRKLYE